MPKSDYVNYLNLKKDFKVSYQGYPLEKILAIELFQSVNLKKISLLKCLGKIFLVRNIKRIHFEAEHIYCIGNYKRKDYYELLSFLINKTDSAKVIDLSLIKFRLSFSLKSTLFALVHIYKNVKSLSFKRRVYLLSVTIHTLNLIRQLDSLPPIKTKLLTSFCSNLAGEAEIDFFIQKNGGKTLSVQHGLWYIFDEGNVDSLVYENINAQKLLCWGQYTKDEFIKFGVPNDKLLVTGYPRAIKTLKPIKNNTNQVLVMLSRKQFHQGNLELLLLLQSVAEKLGLRYHLKLHPSLEPSDYEYFLSSENFTLSNNETIQNLLTKETFLFSISFNSTAYYDSYTFNSICLKYITGGIDDAIDIHDDSFSTAEDFITRYKWLKDQLNNPKFWANTEEKLTYVLGFKIDEYENVFNEQKRN
ncbi:hypothetical protein BG00_09410 [Pseudoalteromonas sp. SCSIO_11900]|uniref:hypothetical protein n=1 Tax=Pseudoalteromonas sp. SCSIO_11900 TaxID=1461766 RepID=UPI0004507963|nr:hypothetical protein [Pseudoalteromonas sp. SCSIO_11900]EWS98598.1 hypothetical protein BG00_09410 [Pseudoalteromonas sp. SCSIO_11900]